MRLRRALTLVLSMDAGRPDFGPYGGDLTYQVLINGVGVDTLSTVSGQGWNTISLNVSLSNGLNTLGIPRSFRQTIPIMAVMIQHSLMMFPLQPFPMVA